LIFEYNDGRISARKEILFHEKDYLVEIKTDVWNGDKAIAHQVAWRGGFGDVHDIGMRGDVVDVFYRDPEKIKRLTANDVKTGEATASGQFDFAGIEDRFFTASFLPQSGPLTVIAFRQDVAVTGQKPRPSVGMAVGSLDNPQNRLRLFVGPKQADVLATVAPRLPEVIDYGWFALVAKPLFIALRWIYSHVIGNYGWAIILLTVFINFALFPLKLKSLRSTMKMQKIQPQMKAIQDKYKQYKATDPRKAQMNQEMMELYKIHGVNPLGGCLPMLIQLPFLYGFYRVLMASIEMRHAPFFWWINDLSAPEAISIKVLPLALCITQFILQRMSPSPSPDPAQQKMMMLMPVMFLFMFWSMSSGLVLYWLTGNVVGIAQQWYINTTEMKQAVEQKKRRKDGKK
jgi:YidC/Oxa1 family membrane protein insertase